MGGREGIVGAGVRSFRWMCRYPNSEMTDTDPRLSLFARQKRSGTSRDVWAYGCGQSLWTLSHVKLAAQPIDTSRLVWLLNSVGV